MTLLTEVQQERRGRGTGARRSGWPCTIDGCEEEHRRSGRRHHEPGPSTRLTGTPGPTADRGSRDGRPTFESVAATHGRPAPPGPRLDPPQRGRRHRVRGARGDDERHPGRAGRVPGVQRPAVVVGRRAHPLPDARLRDRDRARVRADPVPETDAARDRAGRVRNPRLVRRPGGAVVHLTAVADRGAHRRGAARPGRQRTGVPVDPPRGRGRPRDRGQPLPRRPAPPRAGLGRGGHGRRGHVRRPRPADGRARRGDGRLVGRQHHEPPRRGAGPQDRPRARRGRALPRRDRDRRHPPRARTAVGRRRVRRHHRRRPRPERPRAARGGAAGQPPLPAASLPRLARGPRRTVARHPEAPGRARGLRHPHRRAGRRAHAGRRPRTRAARRRGPHRHRAGAGRVARRPARAPAHRRAARRRVGAGGPPQEGPGRPPRPVARRRDRRRARQRLGSPSSPAAAPPPATTGSCRTSRT